MEADAGPSSSYGRARGRQPKQLRTLVCERSLLNRADGSAKWTQDGTSVLASVMGPRQALARKEDAEKAVVEVVFKPRGGLQGHREKDYEQIIQGTLEGVIPLGMHPRTSIQVTLQVVQDDGSVLACALNAACAALLDAGVPMNTMFASVACSLMKGPSDGGEAVALLDPDSKEEKDALSLVTLAFPHHYDCTVAAASSSAGGVGDSNNSSGQAVPKLVVADGLLTSHTVGSFSLDQYLAMYDLSRLGCRAIAEFAQMSLAKSLQVA